VGAHGVGGLPALAKLSLRLRGRWGCVDVRTRVTPAFAAVAGTLTHLLVERRDYNEWRDDEVDVGYEWGVAVGKLRRLRDLALDLSRDGRLYHAVAQGLAASGGECPLPLLWRLGICSAVRVNADLLASLVLPSVRVFISAHANSSAALLLMACALHQAGYKHSWEVWYNLYDEPEGRKRAYREALRRLIKLGCYRVVQTQSESAMPPWQILSFGRLSSIGHDPA
jgi:hypothetical protein